MAGHTPGPWDSHGEDEVMADDRGDHVATAWNNDGISPSEATANARLIAAAPELLEACELFLEMWRRAGPLGSHQFEKFEDVVTKCDSAIRKATHD